MPDVVEIDAIALGLASGPASHAVSIEAEYSLRARGIGPSVLTLFHPGILGVERAASSPFADITTRQQGGYSLIDISQPSDEGFDGLRVTLALRWDHQSVERLKGSPVFVAPSYLPQPETLNGPYYGFDFPSPTEASEMPRLSAPPTLIELAGRVSDENGAALMLAAPLEARFTQHLWHSDNALVLGGELLRSYGETRRRAIAKRLVEIHRFLSDELGRGDRVRLLAVYDTHAPEYARRRDDYSALDEKHLVVDQAGVFKGERLMALHLASLWWSSGVRPAGLDGPTFTLALATYGVMRWFEASRRRSRLSRELEVTQSLKQQAEREGISKNRSLWQAASLSLALHDAAKHGIAIDDELRRWCALDWGKAVPVNTLIDRLVAIGVKVMW